MDTSFATIQTDIKNIGSLDLTVGNGSGSLTVGKYLDNSQTTTVINSDGSTSIIDNPNYNKTVINSDANLNIFNGTDTSYSYQNTIKEKTGVLRQIPVIGQVLAVANAYLMGFVYRGVDAASHGSYSNATDNYRHDVNTNSTTEKLVASNISFNNNLNLTSTKDTSIRSSNLETKTGDIAIISGNDINITTDFANNASSRSATGKSDRKESQSITDASSSRILSSYTISHS